MPTKEEINVMMNRRSSVIADLSVQEQSIAEQLVRLKEARASVAALLEDNRNIVAWIDRYDAGYGWQGSRREEFEEYKLNAKTAGEEYCNQIADAHSIMVDKIQAFTWQQQEITLQKAQEVSGLENLRRMLSSDS